MKLAFTPQAWADYSYWPETDPQTLKRIHQLIKDAIRDPHRGIGKPEPLKQALHGCWSRRITAEHRMVYQVSKGELLIMQLRYHYGPSRAPSSPVSAWKRWQ